MQIIRARVANFDDSDNLSPRIHVLVDHIPTEGFVFEEIDHIFFGKFDGLVRHFRYSGPGKGMGGTEFEIQMKEGPPRRIIGPWPTKSEEVSTLFEPCVNVVLSTDNETFMSENGYQGSFTIERALEALEKALVKESLSPRLFVYHLVAHYSTASGLLYITPILAKELGGIPQLFVGEMALRWMGSFDLREYAAEAASSAASRLWDLIRLIRASGLPLVEQTTMRETAQALSVLAATLAQEPVRLREVVTQPDPEAPSEVPTIVPPTATPLPIPTQAPEGTGFVEHQIGDVDTPFEESE